uniref:Uncharacterized protein n=1 Tax=Aegilops tauschii subsp. strangulata TaxID=200361 RepID=A0A452ZTU7_AEGTS
METGGKVRIAFIYTYCLLFMLWTKMLNCGMLFSCFWGLQYSTAGCYWFVQPIFFTVYSLDFNSQQLHVDFWFVDFNSQLLHVLGFTVFSVDFSAQLLLSVGQKRSTGSSCFLVSSRMRKLMMNLMRIGPSVMPGLQGRIADSESLKRRRNRKGESKMLSTQN